MKIECERQVVLRLDRRIELEQAEIEIMKAEARPDGMEEIVFPTKKLKMFDNSKYWDRLCDHLQMRL